MSEEVNKKKQSEAKPEKIKKAAVYYNNKIYKGNRHIDIINTLKKNNNDISNYQLGYLTNKGKFINKDKVGGVVLSSGQFGYFQNFVFNEDLEIKKGGKL
jgi:hypothetical protein